MRMLKLLDQKKMGRVRLPLNGSTDPRFGSYIPLSLDHLDMENQNGLKPTLDQMWLLELEDYIGQKEVVELL